MINFLTNIKIYFISRNRNRQVTNLYFSKAILGIFICSLLMSGCSNSSNTQPPSIVSSQINDHGPIFRSLNVDLASQGGIEVEYWSTNTSRLKIVSEKSNDSYHQIPLPRLRANSTYSYEIRTTIGSKKSDVLSQGNFTTGDLPNDLKAINISTSGIASQPLVFVSVRSQFVGGVVFDSEGNIVWYARTNIAPQGAVRRSNGNWVIMLYNVGLFEYSPLGELVRSLPQSRMPSGTKIHHGVTETPQKSLIFLNFENREINGQTLSGESIWEWNTTNDSLSKRWSAFDMLDPSVDFGARSTPSDWFHANSISIGLHGNIIVSFHFLDQIISITPDFSSIEWRLGGPGSTFNISANQATSGQHSSRETSDNQILLFDNGYQRANGERYSRVLELKADPITHMVDTVFEYRPSPDIWSSIISSVRRLENGNSFITFGAPTDITSTLQNLIFVYPISIHEVSPLGNISWKALITLPTGSIFQGEPITSIGGESIIP